MSMVAGVTDNDPMKLVRMLVSDPEGLKRQLEQFEKAKASAQKVIDLLGPAGEILTMRKQVEEAKSLAIDAVVVARKKAEDIVAQANKKAKGIVDHGIQVANQKLDAATAKEQNADELREKAQATLAAVQHDKADLEEKLAAVETRMEALDAATVATKLRQDELDRRIGQLEKVRIAMRSILAVP
jgi:chromosome segregation ATPase